MAQMMSKKEKQSVHKQCMKALRGMGAGKKDQMANCHAKLGMKKK